MITHIGALEKGIAFYAWDKKDTLESVNHKWVISSRDYKVLAKAIFEHGISENCTMSSSMDFAKEDGFRTHSGARKLLNRAIRFHNKHFGHKVSYSLVSVASA
tara:strand:- start:136 stop:444 length:309 start_codon:yes stop_codon:yes gene_type:complete